jgi:hypothetical protein
MSVLLVPLFVFKVKRKVDGRKSVASGGRCLSARVAFWRSSALVVREEEMPPFVAVQGFQSKEGLVALQAPELACQLEAPLVLRAGGFDGAGADRLPERLAVLVVHAALVPVEVADLALERFALLRGERLSRVAQALKPAQDVERAVLAPLNLSSAMFQIQMAPSARIRTCAAWNRPRRAVSA